MTRPFVLSSKILQGVLPRFDGELSEEVVPLLLPFESSALPWGMPARDVGEAIRSGFDSGLVLAVGHLFPFEDPKETVGGRVVGTTDDGTHAAGYMVHREEPLIFLGGKLAAAIGMQDERRPAGLLPHRLEHEVAILPRTHRPAVLPQGIGVTSTAHP